MYRSCKKCGMITSHTVSPMDGTGRKNYSCDTCKNKVSSMSYSDRLQNEKRKEEKYKDGRTFNDVKANVDYVMATEPKVP